MLGSARLRKPPLLLRLLLRLRYRLGKDPFHQDDPHRPSPPPRPLQLLLGIHLAKNPIHQDDLPRPLSPRVPQSLLLLHLVKNPFHQGNHQGNLHRPPPSQSVQPLLGFSLVQPLRLDFHLAENPVHRDALHPLLPRPPDSPRH